MRKPFKTLTSFATPLAQANVDTDLIIPGRFLKTVKRSGLGGAAFYDLRYDDNGEPDPDSVFNRPPFDSAQILLAGRNFGCGSSREHAVWALADLGYRCIIAPSFADIFDSNAFKNGILTLTLPEATVRTLFSQAEDGTMTVDLEGQTVTTAAGEKIGFDIDDFRKKCLLEGLDEIALTLQSEDSVSAFETRQRQDLPWLYDAADHT